MPLSSVPHHSSQKQATLRAWQREAFATYQEALKHGQRTILWEATPGSGKTTAALRVAYEEIHCKRAKKVLIVVPTAHLKTQWASAALQFQMHIDSSFGVLRNRLASDFHGAVVTYQQIGNSLHLFNNFAANAIIILDEIHHAADGMTWGNALRAVFSQAPFILCLSGTAFRSDTNPIPFVSYSPDGISVPDYCYSYSRAVEDGVCRPTAFFTFGGEVSWSEKDRVYTARYDDSLDPISSARRLRASLDPAAGWIQPMISEAHSMLRTVRREHHNAGGLIVCADQDHARHIAEELLQLTGQRPTVVLSDDSKASNKIKDFSTDSTHWLVACNMVSEGVDIPRLRVGVYATTIRTKMYFRQFLGRVVRRQANITGQQAAYIYLPADPSLHHFAEEIEQEIRHSINAKDREIDWGNERSTKDKNTDTQSGWTALGAVNSGIDAVIVHGNQLSFFSGSLQPDEVQAAVQREISFRLDSTLTKSEKKRELCSEIKNLVGTLNKRSGKPHSAIHLSLNRMQRVNSQTHCSEEQLCQRAALLREMLIR